MKNKEYKKSLHPQKWALPLLKAFDLGEYSDGLSELTIILKPYEPVKIICTFFDPKMITEVENYATEQCLYNKKFKMIEIPEDQSIP